MNYDLTDLKLFVAVAEAGNLSRGAERAHLAVSSASHRITRLESTIGARLFERKSRGVELTRPGEFMLAGARDVLARLEQLHAINIFLPRDLPDFLSANPSTSGIPA